MPAIPVSTFTERLRTLDHEELTGFVADIWEASGWETRVDHPVVVLGRGSQTRRLLVVPPVRFPRFQRGPEIDGQIDLIVTPQQTDEDAVSGDSPSVPVHGVTDLRNRLLYGIDTESAEQLVTAHLGVSLRGDQYESTESVPESLQQAVADTTERAGPVSRRAVLGLLGLSLAGSGVWLARNRGGDEPSRHSDIEPAVSTVTPVEPPTTPTETNPTDRGSSPEQTAEPKGPPSTSLAFEYDSDQSRLFITRTGGDSLLERNVSLRGVDFSGSPAVEWGTRPHDLVMQLTPDSSVTMVQAEPTVVARVVWEGENGTKRLGQFYGPARPKMPVISGAQSSRYGPGNTGSTPERGSSGQARVVWRFDPGDSLGPSVGVQRGIVVVSRLDGTVYALDGADGQLLWQTTIPGSTGGTATVTTQAVFLREISTERTGIRKLSLKDGSTRWRSEIPHDQLGRVTVSGKWVVFPASSKGNLGGGIYATSTAREGQSWSRGIETLVFPAAVAVTDGTVYTMSPQRISALSLADGTEHWQFRPDSSLFSGFWWPMVHEETLFGFLSGKRRHRVYAFDRTDGTVRWSVDGSRPLWSRPAVDERYVYTVQAGGDVVAISREDQSRWRFDTTKTVTALTVGSDTVYAAVPGRIYAIDAQTGQQLGTIDLSFETVRALTAVGSRLFVAGERMVALGPR